MSPRNATEIGQRRAYTFRGQTYPSVTTILKAWPMEWAIAYGAKAVAERALSLEGFHQIGKLRSADSEDYAFEYENTLKWLKKAPHERRDAAADAGTDLHSYLEARLLGVDALDGMKPESPAERAVEQFLQVYRPDPLYVESQVFSVSDGWAGSCDLFATIYGRTLAIDLKTSPSAPTDHKARLQLAAYRHEGFIGEDDRELAPVPYTDGAAVLAIPRDKPEQWQLIEVPAGQEEYRVFLATKRLWDFYAATQKEAIGELLLPQSEVA